MPRRGCPSLRDLLLLAYGALAGREVCVVLHPDPGLRGLRGRVVEDRARCLRVLPVDGGEPRCVVKSGLFAFKAGRGCWVLLRGEELVGTPSERLRMLEKGKGVRWLVRARKERGYTGCEAAGEDL